MTNLFSVSQLKTARAIWQRGVKSTKRLTGLIVRSTPLVVGGSSLSWVKASFVFSRFAVDFIKVQGHRGLAIYLKAANVSLMRSLAQNKIENPRLAGSAVALSHSGVPRMIPGNHRIRIKQGDKGVIRLWLGFFTLYRVLDFRGKLKFSSIINPGIVLSESLLLHFEEFAPRFRGMIVAKGGRSYKVADADLPQDRHWTEPRMVSPENRKGNFIEARHVSRGDFGPYRTMTALHGGPNGIFNSTWFPFQKRILEYGHGPSRDGGLPLGGGEGKVRFVPLMKSGPNSVDGITSVGSIVKDVVSWVSRPQLLDTLLSMLAITNYWNLIDHAAWRAGKNEYVCKKMAYRVKQKFSSDSSNPEFGNLGRLSVVEEPGKMRVVAMVDCFTQWLLYPLHRFIFDEVLKVIPEDGTFDHVAPVKRLIGKLRASKATFVASFDLSAATDRIPVRLQEIILSQFTTLEFASLWRKLLCDRKYRLPALWLKTHGAKKIGKDVSYAVGQPMGAYSSWAMLALVHHALIQFAAKRAGWKGWFDLYGVLGDDVVIGDHLVATQYKRLMLEIGVEIGFSKSIVSKNLCLEFAKRFFYRGEEVTPLPLVGAACSWLGPSAVPEVIKASSARTGKTPSLYNIARSVGFGFKAASGAATSRFVKLPRSLRSILLLLRQPNGVMPETDLWSWMRLRSWNVVAPTQETWLDPSIKALKSFINSRDPDTLRNKLNAAFATFMPKDVAEADFPGLKEWWTRVVDVSIRKLPLIDLFKYKKLRQRAILRSHSVDQDSLLEILEQYVAFEKFIVRLPVKVTSKREQREVLGSPRPRVAKTIRLWRKLNRLQRSV